MTWQRWTLHRVHASPHVYVIDDFLTDLELNHLFYGIIAKSMFVRSFVDRGDEQVSGVEEEQRTSSFISLPRQVNAKVAGIERKAAEMLGVAVDRVEPLQLVRYQKDQFFGTHHDLGLLLEDGSVDLPPKQAFVKRRLATFFCYLNDVDHGGCTHFPECGDLRVTPKRGRAVLFCNILRDGVPDPLTVHAGEPVKGKPVGRKKRRTENQGNGYDDPVKYGLNVWVCEK